jgi:hypothetical protein
MDDDHKAIIRLARLNVAESQQMVANAKEAAARYQALCESARRQLAADLALLEGLKAAQERTGIIRG